MGSKAQIVLVGGTQETNSKLQRPLVDLLNRIDKVASFYDPDSEINRLPRGTFTCVSDELMELLSISAGYHRETGGTFDITLGKLKSLWDSARLSHHAPMQAEIEDALKSRGMEKIDIAPPFVRIRDPSLRLDLSAVAKGYAIDKGVDFLQSAGAQGGMINIGGDLRVFGMSGPDGQHEWKIGVQDPRPGKRIVGYLLLADQAVATSGNYRRPVDVDKNKMGHIFHPGTDPFQDDRTVLSVTIVSSACADADAMATAVFAMGWKEGLNYLRGKSPSPGYVIAAEKDPGIRFFTNLGGRDFVREE